MSIINTHKNPISLSEINIILDHISTMPNTSIDRFYADEINLFLEQNASLQETITYIKNLKDILSKTTSANHTIINILNIILIDYPDSVPS